jgi:hypothetical protein
MQETTIRITVRAALLAASLALIGQWAWDAWQVRQMSAIGPACEVPKAR